ncbi:MAG TPA: hypothetical protein VFJ50_08540 [Gemmatimonadales bacterium]|nr:hypothetical protein [Gemmatimonadales bacterium]
MRGIGRTADAFEYGRTGMMGWAQEHAFVCVVAVVCAWLVLCYAVVSTVVALGG